MIKYKITGNIILMPDEKELIEPVFWLALAEYNPEEAQIQITVKFQVAGQVEPEKRRYLVPFNDVPVAGGTLKQVVEAAATNAMLRQDGIKDNYEIYEE